MTGDELRRYAEMIVKGCIALKRGDTVLVRPAIAHRGLAVAVAESAYRHGAVFVDGIPLRQCSIARDPRAPVVHDRVAAVIGATAGLASREIGLATVRNPGALAQAVAEAQCCVLICDAETDDDLDAIAAAVDAAPGVLPCGSAGLARALAVRWAIAAADGPAASPTPAVARGDPVLVVVGSASPVAHEQLATLCRTLGVRAVTIDTPQAADPQARRREMERARMEITATRAQVLALTLSQDRLPAPATASVPLEADLGTIAAAWRASRPASAGLICTGGDTALAVCRALGARALWPEGEIAPGVPWGALEHPTQRTVLVSKAGDFGGRRALVDAVEFLRGAPKAQQGVNA